ncbi:MAG: hypothetical protein RLZZ385_1405 [Pseudomonadota bacterium]
MSPTLSFLAGLLACFIGTLPFGPINLTAVKTTVDHGRLQGLEMAAGAAVIEVAQALLAILFGIVISAYLHDHPGLRAGFGVAFMALGVVVWRRRFHTRPVHDSLPSGAAFRRGLLVALLNPQAIPFWIVALAAIDQFLHIDYHGVFIVAFLAGVAAGKLLALGGFIVASHYLKTHLAQSARLVNHVLAVVLIAIGMLQVASALVALGKGTLIT